MWGWQRRRRTPLRLEPLTPSRSVARVGLALFTLDSEHLGPLVPLHSLAHPGLSMPSSGTARSGLCALALDGVKLGPLTALTEPLLDGLDASSAGRRPIWIGSTHFDRLHVPISPSSALNHSRLGFLMPLRSPGHLGLSLLTFSLMRTWSNPFCLGCSTAWAPAVGPKLCLLRASTVCIGFLCI